MTHAAKASKTQLGFDCQIERGFGGALRGEGEVLRRRKLEGNFRHELDKCISVEDG